MYMDPNENTVWKIGYENAGAERSASATSKEKADWRVDASMEE